MSFPHPLTQARPAGTLRLGIGIWQRTGGENLLCLPSRYTVDHKFTIVAAAQFENQVSSIIGLCIHRIHQPHLRCLVQVIVIRYRLKQHLGHAIEIRLSDQGDIFDLAGMILCLSGENQRRPSTVGQLIRLEPLVA